MSMITAFVSAMMAGMERSGAILSLVVLPLTIPVIIFGSSMAGASPDEQATSMLFLAGFSAFMLPVMCLAGASCIRSSN